MVNMDAAGRTEVCMMAVRCFPYGLGSDSEAELDLRLIRVLCVAEKNRS